MTTDAVGVAIIIVITPKLILDNWRTPRRLAPKIISSIKRGIKIVLTTENCQAIEFFNDSLIGNSDNFNPAANHASGEHKPAKKDKGLYIQNAVLSILKIEKFYPLMFTWGRYAWNIHIKSPVKVARITGFKNIDLRFFLSTFMLDILIKP